MYIYVHILNNHVINTAYLISSFLRALCTTGLVAQGINTHPNILPLQNSRDRGKEKKREKESPKKRIMDENQWQKGEGEQSRLLHPVYHRTDYSV